MRRPFLERVMLKNYKSIAACDVELQPLTFLVGPNGSGKSNFLDAIRFTSDALRNSLDHAIRERGGINEVRRRSSGHPTHFGIRLDFNLPDETSGHYAFRVGARTGGGFEVQVEECSLSGGASFRVQGGEARGSTLRQPPPAAPDRLYLLNVSGYPEFRPLYDALSRMGFYNLNPGAIRDLQPPDPGDLLSRDGSNLASVLDRLSKKEPESKKRLQEYLGKVVPGVQAVDRVTIGSKETLIFRQQVAGSANPWRFQAANMSDGTLRALGVLAALLQPVNGGGGVLLTAIEEPEVALHPAAAGVLLDALQEASRQRQVLVTSHSPDLLDSRNLAVEGVLAVFGDRGDTQIAAVDEAGRYAMREHLYTAGELLRLNQLQPDASQLERISSRQLQLFDEPAA